MVAVLQICSHDGECRPAADRDRIVGDGPLQRRQRVKRREHARDGRGTGSTDEQQQHGEQCRGHRVLRAEVREELERPAERRGEREHRREREAGQPHQQEHAELPARSVADRR